MKHLPIIVLITAAFAVSPLPAQTFDGLEFGTAETFEVVTWNIEWFPKDGATTVSYVSDIIEALDVDLIAMQELDDTAMFDQMMADLDQYVGYYESGWFAGLAYIYNPDAITVNDIYEIYTTEEYWGAFPRSPMVMNLTFNDETIYVINNHYKCCGDGDLDFGNTSDEEYRRYRANELLKQYIDVNLPDSKVILLGDLNDILTDSAANNVFQMFLNDSDNYLFADLAIEQGPSSNWSYPTWPSHLDHILVTDELFEALDNANSAVTTIRIDDYFTGGWWAYDNAVSDHRPVAMRLDLSTTSDIGINTPILLTLSCHPNPFNPITTLSYELLDDAFVELAIYNSRGQQMDVLEKATMTAGHHQVNWNATGFSDGAYFARLSTGGQTVTRKIMLIK